MEAALVELTNFLKQETRPEIKQLALKNISGLTSSEDGLRAIIKNAQLLKLLLESLNNQSVADSLINISASEAGARELLKITSNNIVDVLLKAITNPQSENADQCCMILSNLTRTSENADKVIDLIENSGFNFDDLIAIFTKNGYNVKGGNLHYLSPVFENLSQNFRVRKYILDKEKCVIQRLLPFTGYLESVVRRKGVVATLKNCCFDVEHHEWLLGENVDILPNLLLPLADGTEFDEEDNDKLPIELQYLPEDKHRESDAEIRKMLLEAVTQLCAKKTNREYIRDKNTYVILRELHKWERDHEAKAACENLVDILIRTEEEIGAENLKEVDIPAEIQQKLDEITI